MGSRKIKQEVLNLLAGKSVAEALVEFGRFKPKDVINCLFTFICSHDEVIRWRAISCMGIMVARLADEDMEEGRIIMRRFLWSLNDESGGIGWGAPESMAEAMHHHEGLADEYIHMLVSYTLPDGPEIEQDGNFLEHEVLQRGLLWGLNRLCLRRKSMLIDKGAPENLGFYLTSDDGAVAGLAIKLVGNLQVTSCKELVGKLVGDRRKFVFYQDDCFFELQVGELAATVLRELS